MVIKVLKSWNKQTDELRKWEMTFDLLLEQETQEVVMKKRPQIITTTTEWRGRPSTTTRRPSITTTVRGGERRRGSVRTPLPHIQVSNGCLFLSHSDRTVPGQPGEAPPTSCLTV